MRISAILAAMLACGLAQAQGNDLHERVINVQYGESGASYAPVSLPYDGDVGDKVVTVRQVATGKDFPATVRNGELVFVPEGGLAGREHQYTVYVHDTTAAPVVRLDADDDKDTVAVYIEDQHFTTYHYSSEWKKPFMWPVISDGVEVTRAWPMGEKELSADHPHHKSFWVAYGDLDTTKVQNVDCWAEGKNSGIQTTKAVTYGDGGAYAWIAADNVWTAHDGTPVIDESREYRIYATPSRGRLLDLTVTFTASYGDVTFGDTKEGGIAAFRVRDVMTVENGGTITLTDDRTEGVWGKPSAWCDYSGELEDGAVHGVAIFDHPDNLRHPTRWHVRDYGLVGANCFGLSYFTDSDNSRLGDYTVADGETLTFNYRIFIHTGDAEQSGVAARYGEYLTPPKAAWADAP